MGRLGKPAGAGFGDDHVVLEAHAEFAVDADGRFVREGHAGPQHGLVALHEIGPFVHVEADAVAGAMREAGSCGLRRFLKIPDVALEREIFRFPADEAPFVRVWQRVPRSRRRSIANHRRR
jgi:hypothetical protein